MASSSFLKGSVIAMPKKFSALNNSTIHTIALRTQHSAPDLRFTLHALRITLYAQLATRNPQPDFGANAPPTYQFYALRFTHHALRITSHAHFPKSPILPSNPLNHAP
jgi:hypothetical protein